MSEGARYRQRARTFEQRENWKRAIEAYELAIQADRRERKDVDLALYNRLGDLYRRIGDVNKAVHYYELAADGHLAAGFYNNAIALCNKILRNQPNRHSAYLKLGKIGAAKGFLSDARRHFLEYAERMQRSGQLDKAFAALIEFADLSPDPEVRLMVADQLIEHDRTMQGVEQLRLAWRDLSEEGREADAQEVRQRVLELAAHRDPEVDPPEASTSSAIDAEGVLELPEILPWDDEEPEPEPETAGVQGPQFVTTRDFDSPGDAPADTPEHTSEGGGDDFGAVGLEEAEIDIEGVDIDSASLEELEDEIFGTEPGELGEPPLDIVPTSLADEEPEVDSPAPGEEDLGIVPTSLTPQPPAEEPSLELEEPPAADWDEPTAVSEPPPEPAPPAEAVTPPAEPAPPPIRDPVATPVSRISELESRLKSEGRQPELLVELAEALLETGQREKATVCLGEALEGYEQQGQYWEAGRVLDELLRLNVNDFRAHQKRVELALRAGDRSGLIEAYLGLADCLDRTDASNKARAVYQRVLELDPQNRRAASALEMFVEEEAAPAEAEPAATQSATPARAARDYVDLGSLVLEEDAEGKDTRFRIPATDPKSEADVNFSEMLSQFKSMVAETIEEEDAASHYDLGCAYRDMGLIDEAIAEFQIAARGLEYRLRAIEMLGACFVDKGDQRIALKVLTRALQVPGHKDEELVGIFYAMGRSYEDLGDARHALEWYERVLGCDVHFKDVAQRVAALRQ